MAKKDWKKMGKYNWHWKKGAKEVEIIDASNYETDEYGAEPHEEFIFVIREKARRIYEQNYRSLAKALKFARAYMRKH